MFSKDDQFSLAVVVGLAIGGFSTIDRPVFTTTSPEAVYLAQMGQSTYDVTAAAYAAVRFVPFPNPVTLLTRVADAIDTTQLKRS